MIITTRITLFRRLQQSPKRLGAVLRRGLTALLVLALLVVAYPQAANAEDTTERLRTSVARMNHWLGVGSKAQTWRKILNLNVLDSQTAKGEQADPQTLRGLLGGFDQSHKSLQHPVFREVRNSIQAQIEQIDRTRSQELADLQFAAYQAISGFKQPTVAQLKIDRDVAKYELQVLKKVYRRDFDSKSRAIVFHKLKLNETIKFLSDLEFELPPEVSTGKIRSMITDEQKLLEDVIDKIDALPLATPEEDSDDDEDDIVLDIQLSPPGPDNDDEEDLESLEARKEAIEGRVKELTRKFREVRKADNPRQLRRRTAGIELLRVQRRFRSLAKKETGPSFAAAKSAIDRFADAYVFGTEDNIQQEYLERVKELAKLIPDLDNANARNSHAKLGDILQWLEDRQQLRDLCVAIRRRYSNPNAYVSISSRMINSVASQTSGEYDRVAEDFLGRFARGLSYTNTTVNVVPTDDPDQVRASILLGGTLSTDTYIRELSFRINSSASGHLSARRDLYANLNGLWASKSSADASIATQYGGISSNLRLIQKFAAKSFAKEKGRADAESTRRAKDRLQTRFDSETSELIDDGISQIESIAEQARAFASFLPHMFLRSFSDRVEAVAKKDTRIALGATVNPTFRTAGSDVQLKLHDSMLSNYLDLFFAGRKFSQSDLMNEFKELAGDVELFPAAEGEDDGEEEVEEFSITFPKVRPIQVKFNDNRIGVTITGTQFEQGDNKISTRLEISVSLKVVNRDGKLFAIPAGDPTVELSTDEEPGAESITVAKILEKRLKEGFEESGDKGFELPPNLLPEIPQLESVDVIKSLQLGLFELKDGWLYLGWNYRGGSVNTPAIWKEFTIDGFEHQYRPSESAVLIEQQAPTVIETAPIAQEEIILLPMMESVVEQPVVISGQ